MVSMWLFLPDLVSLKVEELFVQFSTTCRSENPK